jgi:hypothetical protein
VLARGFRGTVQVLAQNGSYARQTRNRVVALSAAVLTPALVCPAVLLFVFSRL